MCCYALGISLMAASLSILQPQSAATISTNSNTERRRRLLLEQKKTRILYTVTSLAEYNSGERSTVKGSDRLKETIIPVLVEGVESMLAVAGYAVDIFLVAGFVLREERLQLIRDALPESVGLRYWDDAIPLGYDSGKFTEGGDGTSRVDSRGISLARQHRFVVKDNLMDYDFFVNFEDDMLIKGNQVQHYLRMSDELEQLYNEAPEDLPGRSKRYYASAFHGNMTKGQLLRTLPGFIRVEVGLDTSSRSSTTIQPTIPFDEEQSKLDPAACCQVTSKHSSPKRPESPEASQIMLWESTIQALGVRQMPNQDWVALLRGPKFKNGLAPNSMMGDYWSGRDGAFHETKRPGPDARNNINNQGGWMATRKQIYNWHTRVCPGGFLPPFDPPHYRFDGLDLRDVEWWSGGLSLVTYRHACNMQRIVSLDHFEQHLVYHTANNKQTQLSYRRFTKASDLVGQLRTTAKNAEKAIAKEGGK